MHGWFGGVFSSDNPTVESQKRQSCPLPDTSQQKETVGPRPNLWRGGRCGIKDSSFKSSRGLRSKDSFVVDEASFKGTTRVMFPFNL